MRRDDATAARPEFDHDLVKPALELFEEGHGAERLRTTPLAAWQRRFRSVTERDEGGA